MHNRQSLRGFLPVVGKVLILGFCGLRAGSFSQAQTVTTVAVLSSTMGAGPQGRLTQGSDGNFYGTTEYNGAHAAGTVFQVTPAGAVTVLYNFCPHPNCADGANPLGGLVQATDGNFYGTTSSGGTAIAGAVFRMTQAGKVTTLYSFCSQTGCSDGKYPSAALVEGADGNLYGETANGGSFGGACGTYGCGTLFKITPAGALTTLYTFCTQPNDNCTDGELPVGGLIQGRDRSFYGTTASDGNSATCPNGCGTIFRFSPPGVLTTLYTFCSQQNCADGTGPGSGVIEGADGNLYGTTSGGGIEFCGQFGFGCGTVFKLSQQGDLTTLHSFDNTDGTQVSSGLVQATDGNFYGTTYAGGIYDNCFGTCGTIFEMNPSGEVTTLYNFCAQTGCADGNNPFAGLVQGTDGKFYGTTFQGGVESFICGEGCGTIFAVNQGLGPFVVTRPASGPVNTKITILGSHLKGATSVKFHNVAARFKVVSNTEITAEVPAGATTGLVTVTLPVRILKSNVRFHVTTK